MTWSIKSANPSMVNWDAVKSSHQPCKCLRCYIIWLFFLLFLLPRCAPQTHKYVCAKWWEKNPRDSMKSEVSDIFGETCERNWERTFSGLDTHNDHDDDDSLPLRSHQTLVQERDVSNSWLVRSLLHTNSSHSHGRFFSEKDISHPSSHNHHLPRNRNEKKRTLQHVT